MTLHWLFAILVAVSLATPIAGPTVMPPVALPNVLSFGGTAEAASCVVGQYLIVAGGYDNVGVYTGVDVIDFVTGTKVDSANMTVGHAELYGTNYGTDGCLIVSGWDSIASDYSPVVELIKIDLATGMIVNITQEADYPTPVYDHACTTDPATGYVWCFGGDSSSGTTNYAAYFNGTGWTDTTPLPIAWRFDTTYTGGRCVPFESKIYCCGNEDTATNFCQVIDPVTQVWSNVTTSERGYAGVAVVDYPTPKLVFWGGYNTSVELYNLDVIVNGVASTYPVGLTSSYFGATFGIGTYAVGFAGYYGNSDYVSLLYTLDASTTPVVEGQVVLATLPEWVSSGTKPYLYGNVGGAYKNRALFCGGYPNSGTNAACWYFDFVCLGNSTSGNDVWVDNAPTYVGCDMVQCHKGYYGSSCTACNCNGQGCDDGYYGTGVCTCAQGYYGADCSQQQVCSGNGYINDGITGNGTCLCFDGYWGATCAQGPVVCSANSVFNHADGTCVCNPGYYGSDCSNQCNCGGSTCDDGNAGTGECYCAPGTYTPSGGVNCSGTCSCGSSGICDDGNYGTGSCQCGSGYYGSDCAGVCSCPPVVYSPTEIKIFRCDDGASGTGACIRLYSSASMVSSFFGLISVCLALFFF